MREQAASVSGVGESGGVRESPLALLLLLTKGVSGCAQLEVFRSRAGRLTDVGCVWEQLEQLGLLSQTAAPAASTTPSSSGASAVVVRSAANPALGATVLVNAQGMTLYSLSGEQGGKFICTSSACTQVWHPLSAAAGTPERQRRLAGDGQAPRRHRAGDLQGDAAVHVRRGPEGRGSQGTGHQGRRHVDRRDSQRQ